MLADDFFRLAHHDVSGRPRAGERAVGLGLAAALLGELLAVGLIEVMPNDLVIPRLGEPPDATLAVLWADVVREPAFQPVPVWLAFVADSSYRRVGSRLHGAGGVILRRRWHRDVFVPVDMNAAALPAALLSQKLRRRAMELTADEICLAGLVVATGLDAFVLDGADAEASARLRWWVSRMPTPMRIIVDHLHAAVGNAVLAHR